MRKPEPFRTIQRIFASLLLISAITTFYFFIFKQANATTIALSFLLAILAIATAGGLLEAIVASVLGVLCFNFFFLPPLFTFYLADTQNWVALFAFLVTAVVASQLSASAKRRAMEAMRQREEVERLYELSRALMSVDKQSPTASQISRHIAQVFNMTGVAVYDREAEQVYTTGAIEDLISGSTVKDSATQNTAFYDTGTKLSVLPLNLGTEPLGSLALFGGTISEKAVQAIANLAAIAMERSRAEAVAGRMEAARQNEAMKAMLLDALAHEFKTPLTSIKAASSSILDEAGAAQTELRAIIEEEVDRLDSLVTETIRMARIEAGELELQIRPQDVRALIAAALEKLKIQIEDREIKVRVMQDVPEVLADADLTSLMIRQLVSNALKYSDPESPVEIRACAEGGFVKMSVYNRGPGIPERERARIFERYYRMPQHADRVPGTGLGLHIAKNIVEAHGGKILVDSNPGIACEFSVTLPAVEVGAPR